jgi:hypothetical protein
MLPRPALQPDGRVVLFILDTVVERIRNVHHR